MTTLAAPIPLLCVLPPRATQGGRGLLLHFVPTVAHAGKEVRDAPAGETRPFGALRRPIEIMPGPPHTRAARRLSPVPQVRDGYAAGGPGTLGGGCSEGWLPASSGHRPSFNSRRFFDILPQPEASQRLVRLADRAGGRAGMRPEAAHRRKSWRRPAESAAI